MPHPTHPPPCTDLFNEKSRVGTVTQTKPNNSGPEEISKEEWHAMPDYKPGTAEGVTPGRGKGPWPPTLFSRGGQPVPGVLSSGSSSHPALTCNSLQEPANVENAFLHDALHARREDGHQGHHGENEDPHGQENSSGLPETAGNLPEALGVGPAQCVPRDLLHARRADAKDAQVVGLRVSACRLGGASAANLSFPDQPVCAHEGNELGKGHHDTQEGPEHRAAGDNDMTHIDVHGGKAR